MASIGGPAAVLNVVLKAQSAMATAELKKFDRQLHATARSAEDSDKKIASSDKTLQSFGRSATNTNQKLELLSKGLSVFKWPAFAAGAGAAAEGISALGAGAVALTSALGPLTGALVAYPALLTTIGQVAAVKAVAGLDDLGTAVGGLNEKLDKQSTEYKKLSEQGQKFARTLNQAKGPIRDMQQAVQRPLFRGLNEGLDAAMKNLPSLRRVLVSTGDAMGDVAKRAGELVGSKGFGRDFEKIGENNAQLLRRLGTAGINFGDALRHVLVAARPLIDWMGKSIVRFSEWIDAEAKAGRESGKLAGFFENTRSVMQRLINLGGSLATIFLNIGHAAKPLGDEILGTLVQKAKQLAEWTGSRGGQKTMAQYFEDAKKPLWEAARLLGDIVKAFFDISKGGQLTPLLHALRTDLLPALTDVIKNTTRAFGPRLIDALVEISRLFGVIGGSNGPLVLTLDLFTHFLRIINNLIDQVPILGTALTTYLGAKAVKNLLGGGGILGFLSGGGLLKRLGLGGGGVVGGAISAAKPVPVFVTNPGFGLPGGKGPAPVPTGVPGAGGTIEKIFQKIGLGGIFTKLGGTTGLLTKVLGPAGAAVAVGKLIDTLGWFDAGGPISKIPALSKVLGLDDVSFSEKTEKITDLAGAMDKVGKSIERTGHVSRRDLEALATQIRTASDAGLHMEGAFKEVANRLSNRYGSLLNAARHMSKGQRDAFIDMARAAHDAGDITDKQFGRVMNVMTQTDAMWERRAKHIASVTGERWQDVSKATNDMRVKVSGDYKGMVEASVGSIDWLMSNTQKAAKALGIKQEIKWRTDPASTGAKSQPGHSQQTGGVIPVPGQGYGDRVPAMLEPGEVVINRKAVAAMGGAAKVDSINRKIPRFAKGGVVVPGDTGGLHQGILNFVSSLYQKYGGSVTSGLRASDSDSLHSTGQAADYVPGNWAGAAAAANAAGRSLLEGIYNPAVEGGPAVSWDTGQHVPSSFWGGSTWAGHQDHIHLAIADGVKVAAAAAVKAIKNRVLEGPAGPLKDIGQAAIDKVHAAANAYLRKHAPQASVGETGYVPGGGGPVVMQMARILAAHRYSQAGAAGIIGNAYGESHWDPSAVGTGGGGLFGFTSGPVSLAALQSYAQRQKMPWTDVGLQMQFMLSGSGTGGLESGAYGDLEAFLKSTSDVSAATLRFMNEWERPGIPRTSVRLSGAQQAMGMIGSLFSAGGKGKKRLGGIIEKLAAGGVVAGGDSLMQGMWDNVGFPHGWDVWHVGGAQSSEIAGGILGKIKGGEDAVAFEGGPNDGGKVSAVKAAIKRIKQKSKAPLVVQTLADHWDNAAGINAMLRHVGAAEIADWGKIGGNYAPHPDAEGYKRMHDLLKTAVNKARKKRGGGGGGGTGGGGSTNVGILDASQWHPGYLGEILAGDYQPNQYPGSPASLGQGGGGLGLAGVSLDEPLEGDPKVFAVRWAETLQKIGKIKSEDRRKRVIDSVVKLIGKANGRGIAHGGDEGAILNNFLGYLLGIATDMDSFAQRVPEGGKLGGRTALQWYQAELDTLWRLRTLLIQSYNETVGQQTKVTEMSTRVGELMGNYQKHFDKANERLNEEGKPAKDYKGPDPLTMRVSQWNNLPDKKRKEAEQRWKQKGGKLPGNKLFLEDGTIATPESHPTLFPDPVPWQRRLDAGKAFQGALGGQAGFLGEGLTALKESLDTVQGTVLPVAFGGIDPMQAILTKEPPLGVMGGMIGAAQDAIALATSQLTENPNFEELAAYEREQGRLANLRYLVSQAQYQVLAGAKPLLGMMAEGGMVSRSGLYLVGEQGPEVVGLNAGQQVTPNQALSATVVINGDIINTPPGKQPVEVQGAKAIVQKGSRGYGKRPLPGARGY